MKIAIPIWEARVSPVLDVAQRVLLAEVEADRCTRLGEQLLASQEPTGRANELTRLGVTVVLCAGLSDDLARALAGRGICVVPHWCGPAADVLNAYLGHEPDRQDLIMPGCHCHGRRHAESFSSRHKLDQTGLNQRSD